MITEQQEIEATVKSGENDKQIKLLVETATQTIINETLLTN